MRLNARRRHHGHPWSCHDFQRLRLHSEYAVSEYHSWCVHGSWRLWSCYHDAALAAQGAVAKAEAHLQHLGECDGEALVKAVGIVVHVFLVLFFLGGCQLWLCLAAGPFGCWLLAITTYHKLAVAI